MPDARICAVITRKNAGVRSVENMADFFEVRIDLVGKGWETVAARLNKPWIAANRDTAHGGKWNGSEKERTAELLKALEMGADIIDIETDASSAGSLVKTVKKKARCMVSFHDWEGTPPPDYLEGIVRQQLSMKADLCKVIATARCVNDNITMLDLIKKFPGKNIIAFAMGAEGLPSRILCPLTGGYLTYASIKADSASAPGQITVEAMRSIYRMIKR